MNEVHYYYAVMILRNGDQWPVIRVPDYGINRLIEYFGVFEMRIPENVLNFIEELEASKNKEKHFMYHDCISLEIQDGLVKIFEDSTEPEHCEISVDKLLEILKGWHEFLLAYENGEIPGIIPNVKRG